MVDKVLQKREAVVSDKLAIATPEVFGAAFKVVQLVILAQGIHPLKPPLK
jgi:hypothetical protein